MQWQKVTLRSLQDAASTRSRCTQQGGAPQHRHASRGMAQLFLSMDDRNRQKGNEWENVRWKRRLLNSISQHWPRGLTRIYTRYTPSNHFYWYIFIISFLKSELNHYLWNYYPVVSYSNTHNITFINYKLLRNEETSPPTNVTSISQPIGKARGMTWHHRLPFKPRPRCTTLQGRGMECFCALASWQAHWLIHCFKYTRKIYSPADLYECTHTQKNSQNKTHDVIW